MCCERDGGAGEGGGLGRHAAIPYAAHMPGSATIGVQTRNVLRRGFGAWRRVLLATGGPAWPRSERGGQEHRVSCCPGLQGAGGGRGLGARGSDVTRLCDVVTSLLGSLQERLSVWDPPEESRGWTRARFQESFWRPPLEDHSSAGKGHSLQPPRRSLFCHQGRAWGSHAPPLAEAPLQF